MNIAVFGGTGFMGYDFVKLLIDQNGMIPSIYSSNPANLTNVARHDVDIQFFHIEQLWSQNIPERTNWIVNFAHPFLIRDGLSPEQQIKLYIEFFRKQLDANSELKIIHISSMSVYEPFRNNIYFSEESKVKPPKSDKYAFNKYVLEQSLLKIPDINNRLLILRPTIVYGPFCRPWTDNILSKLNANDSAFNNLSGKIQPIYVGDISRFLLDCIKNFRPGIFNLGASTVVDWHEFLSFFEEIANKGKLVAVEKKKLTNRKRGLRTEIKKLISTINQEPSFVYLFKPVMGVIPKGLRTYIKNFIHTSDYSNLKYQDPLRELDTTYCQGFFAQDRLVSMERFLRNFPGFKFTGLHETYGIIRDYFTYRFTDKLYVSKNGDRP